MCLIRYKFLLLFFLQLNMYNLPFLPLADVDSLMSDMGGNHAACFPSVQEFKS